MHHPFKQLLLTYIHLSEEEWAGVEENLMQLTWKKGEMLASDVAKSGDLFFLEKGLLRFYMQDSDGERTFLFKDAPYAFFGGQEIQAGQSIQALEPATAWRLPKDYVLQMSFQVKHWDVFVTRLVSEIRKHHNQVQHTLEGLSAEDWYKKMLTNCDPILGRIPVKFLASYLGTTPSLLNKLRKKLMSEMTLSRYITANI